MLLASIFCEDVPLVEFIYVDLLACQMKVTVSESDICCCVPCLSSAINSLSLLILHRRSRPHSVSDFKESCVQELSVFRGITEIGVIYKARLSGSVLPLRNGDRRHILMEVKELPQ